jgi:tryptophanyl-tRNA synthetase
MENLPEVDTLLQKGANKASAVATEVLKRVRTKLGFGV